MDDLRLWYSEEPGTVTDSSSSELSSPTADLFRLFVRLKDVREGRIFRVGIWKGSSSEYSTGESHNLSVGWREVLADGGGVAGGFGLGLLCPVT